MKWYVLNLNEDPLVWGDNLLFFDDAESAHQFMSIAKRLYGFNMADYLVVNTHSHPINIDEEDINATNLRPLMGDDKQERLVVI